MGTATPAVVVTRATRVRVSPVVYSATETSAGTEAGQDRRREKKVYEAHFSSSRSRRTQSGWSSWWVGSAAGSSVHRRSLAEGRRVDLAGVRWLAGCGYTNAPISGEMYNWLFSRGREGDNFRVGGDLVT